MEMSDCESQIIFSKDRYAETHCCGSCKYYDIDDFDTIYNLIINLKDLTTYDKNIILTRFKRISKFVSKNYDSVYRYYNISKIFIITAGIITPALMSINGSTTTSSGSIGFNSMLFIFIWLLQLFISIITSYINFYKWDKKFFLYMAYKNKIDQEIWLYLELSSRYGKINNKNLLEKNCKITTHASKLKLFLNRVEYLYKKLKESEYEIEITEEEKIDKHEDTKQLDKDFSPSFLKSTNGLYTTPTDTEYKTDANSKNIEMNVLNSKNIDITVKKDYMTIMLQGFRYVENIYKLSWMIESDDTTISETIMDNYKEECRKNVDAFNILIEYIMEFKNKNKEEFVKSVNEQWENIIKIYPNNERYNKLLCEYFGVEQIPIETLN